MIRIVLPLVALVFGTAALGSELEDGTGVHLLTKPIDRWTIVVAKIVVAGTLTAACVVPSTVLSGHPHGRDRVDRDSGSRSRSPWPPSSASYLYTSIFLVLSRRDDPRPDHRPRLRA